MSQLTLGQRRVRVNLNPSANQDVEKVKAIYAQQIDDLEEYRVGPENPEQGEIARCIAVAQTKIEGACEKHVKAITASL